VKAKLSIYKSTALILSWVLKFEDEGHPFLFYYM